MNRILSNIRCNTYRLLVFSIILSFSTGYLLRVGVGLPRFTWWVIGICLLLLILFILPSKEDTKKRRGFVFLWSGIPIFCMVLYVWFESTFGEFDIGSIIFHIEMGAENTATRNIYKTTIKFIAVLIGILLPLSYLSARYKEIQWCDRLLALPIFCLTPFFTYLVGYAFYHEDDGALLQHYVQSSKDGYSLGAINKNIILIYAESTERTFADLDEGPEIFQEMMRIADQGLHVKGIQQVVNTGWTFAGLISSQCGVPLQPLGMMRGNNFESRMEVLPGVVCISDIAAHNGFNTEFLNGTDLSFAGTDRFLKQHGYQSVGAYAQHKESVGAYLNDWGLYDDTLLKIAEQRVEALHKEGKPFLLTVMTIGGHFPVGHPTQECLDKFGPIGVEKILFSAKCTGYHIESFIDNLRKNNLLNNTVVIVMSDHLVMQNPVLPRLEKLDRMNYFTVLSDDIKPELITKKSAMFDVFPTILELTGLTVPDSKAGLGVSLLSNRPSLLEELGDENLNRYIKYDKSLSRKIWTAP